MGRPSRASHAVVALCSAVVCAAMVTCAADDGPLEDGHVESGAGGAGGAGSGTGGTGGSVTSVTVSSTGGQSSTTVTASSSTGVPVCMKGDTQKCQTGMPSHCADGSQTCLDDGSGWDICTPLMPPMPEDCTVPGDEDCDGISCSDVVWAVIYGNVGNQWGRGVATDDQGNIIVAGSFSGNFDLKKVILVAAGAEDYFVAKFDSNGDLIWAKAFGDAADQSGDICVAVDKKSGRIVIGGTLRGSVDFGGGPLVASQGASYGFFALFDSGGNHVWSEQFGNDNTISTVNLVDFDDAGDVLASATYYSSSGLDLGAFSLPATQQSDDAWIAKLAAKNPNDTGTPLWATHIADGAVGPFGSQWPRGIAHDAANNVFVTGIFDGSLGGICPDQLSDSNSKDIFMTKLDTSGTPVWTRVIASPDYDFGTVIRVDQAGNVVVGGSVAGSVDFGAGMVFAPHTTSSAFIAKYSNDGVLSWAKVLPGSDIMGGSALDHALGIDASGNIVFAGVGNLMDFGGGLIDAPWLVKLDGQGSYLWAKQFAQGNGPTITDLALDPSGDEVLTGWVYGTTDFGTGPLKSFPGGPDLLIVKYQP